MIAVNECVHHRHLPPARSFRVRIHQRDFYVTDFRCTVLDETKSVTSCSETGEQYGVNSVAHVQHIPPPIVFAASISVLTGSSIAVPVSPSHPLTGFVALIDLVTAGASNFLNSLPVRF